MTTLTPKRGDIWLVDFAPSRGAEIQKVRPALVVSSDDIGRLPLRVVVPITDWKNAYTDFPWFVQLTPDDSNGLSKTSGADAFQVKSVSTDRFVRRLGSVSNEQHVEVLKAIFVVFGISYQ